MTKSELLSKTGTFIKRLYLGTEYPIFIGTLVFLGHALEIELYLCALNIIITSLGLALTLKARPLIFFAISFIYQVSRKNSPGIPEPSDYYFTSPRLFVLVLLVLIFALSFAYYAHKVRLFSGLRLGNIPLLFPLSALSLAFTLNGAFSEQWNKASLVFGAMEAVCYAALFLFFYLALLREREGLVDYFVFCCAVLSAVITLEVLLCYILQGTPTKESLLFGWGIWNTAGVSLTVLIPTSLLGFAKGKPRYFSFAVLTLISAALTMSRNAILFGTLSFVLSLAVMAIYGKRRTFALSALLPGAVAVLALAVFMQDRLFGLIAGFLNDNGRFEIWRLAISNFLSAPMFGVGFFGADFGTFFTADFLPTMAHGTFFQLLSAMGIFGLSAYLFYRGATLVPFLRGHSLDKTMLGLSALTLLFESLIDNFVFFFSPTIQYTVLLAVVFVIYRKNGADNLSL